MAEKEENIDNRIIQEISRTFDPEKASTKKSLQEIIAQRPSPISYVERELYPVIADMMVKRKYLFRNNGQVFVFSKDIKQNYFWQPATRADKFIGYFNATIDNLLSLL